MGDMGVDLNREMVRMLVQFDLLYRVCCFER